MQINYSLKKFIQEHSSSIDANQFDYIYQELARESNKSTVFGITRESIGNFTLLMLTAGINPLNYLDKVPYAYLFGVKASAESSIGQVVEIPDHITYIGPSAFEFAHGVFKVIIPKSVKQIYGDSFANKGIVSIEYAGTIEDWNNINKSELFNGRWDAYTKVTIQCVDGVIKNDKT